jgi:hypothetical protein
MKTKIIILFASLLLISCTEPDGQKRIRVRTTIKDISGNPLANVPYEIVTHDIIPSKVLELPTVVARGTSDDEGRIEQIIVPNTNSLSFLLYINNSTSDAVHNQNTKFNYNSHFIEFDLPNDFDVSLDPIVLEKSVFIHLICSNHLHDGLHISAKFFKTSNQDTPVHISTHKIKCNNTDNNFRTALGNSVLIEYLSGLSVKRDTLYNLQNDTLYTLK